MKIAQVLETKNKEVIDFVEGKIKGVYTKLQTPAQKKHDIHPQDVVVEDDTGVSVRMIIMRKAMHIPENSKGRTIKFESIPDDNGNMKGLSVDIYENVLKVNVEGAAAIEFTDKEPPAQKQEPEKQQVRREQPEPKSLPPEVSSRGSGVSTLLNIKDHCLHLADIVREMDSQLSGTSMASETSYSDYLTRLATTVYIQMAKEGSIKKRQPVRETPHMTQPAPSKPDFVETLKAEPEPPITARVSVEYIVNKAIAGQMRTAEVNQLDAQGGYDWELIYTALETKLIEDGFKLDNIGAAYDESKAFYSRRTKSFNNAAFCRTLLCDVGSFIDVIRRISEDATSKPAEQAQPDEPEDPTIAGFEDDIPY